jgi:hypothetical protein
MLARSMAQRQCVIGKVSRIDLQRKSTCVAGGLGCHDAALQLVADQQMCWQIVGFGRVKVRQLRLVAIGIEYQRKQLVGL